MAQMAVAASAADLDPVHAVTVIVYFDYSIGGGGRGEAGPAGAAVEFIGRLKQQRSAATAMECAFAFLDIQRTAKRPLGASLTQNMILHR